MNRLFKNKSTNLTIIMKNDKIDNFDNVFFYLVELFHIRPFSYHWIRSYSRHLTASFLILISISYSCQLYLA